VSAGAERARLFVALELPVRVREALDGWRSEAGRELRRLRMVGPEALHVTLCFLGWRSTDEIEQIGEALVAVLGRLPAPELSIDGPVWLPERRPRVLAVRLADRSGALARIQASLAAALSSGGWYALETRPFLAHVTVARVPRGERIRAPNLGELPSLSFVAEEVTLYRSHLGAGGARYEPLRTIAVGSIDALTPEAPDPVSVVRAFHVEQGHAYAGGHLAALRRWLADDVVWHVPGRSRIAGEHRGVEEVLAYFDARRQMTDKTFRVTVHGLELIGDRVVQLAGGSAVRGGRTLRWETVGIFRVSGGRIAECWLVPFDLYEFDELWR
jgi:2'-5' RNA ligase